MLIGPLSRVNYPFILQLPSTQSSNCCYRYTTVDLSFTNLVFGFNHTPCARVTQEPNIIWTHPKSLQKYMYLICVICRLFMPVSETHPK